jgi:hypothetical protein
MPNVGPQQTPIVEEIQDDDASVRTHRAAISARSGTQATPELYSWRSNPSAPQTHRPDRVEGTSACYNPIHRKRRAEDHPEQSTNNNVRPPKRQKESETNGNHRLTELEDMTMEERERYSRLLAKEYETWPAKLEWEKARFKEQFEWEKRMAAERIAIEEERLELAREQAESDAYQEETSELMVGLTMLLCVQNCLRY